jgi:hypothetical protein
MVKLSLNVTETFFLRCLVFIHAAQQHHVKAFFLGSCIVVP